MVQPKHRPSATPAASSLTKPGNKPGFIQTTVQPKIVQTTSQPGSTPPSSVAGPPQPHFSSRDGRVRVYLGDNGKILPTMQRGGYRLIFADPPFNIDYPYDQYKDKKHPHAYVDWSRDWIGKCVPLLAYNGAMVVAIGDDHAADLKIILDRTGLKMRNWIIWHYTFGVHCTTKFGRDHTHLLYYVKDEKNLVFNPDAIRIESERQRLGDKRAVSKGRVPGDVWNSHYESDQEFTDQVWSVPRLVGNAKERTEHPCQMPESILERIILALTNDRDVVLDPFAGSGTTLAVAKRLGRMADGIEESQNYIDTIIGPRVAGA